MNDDFERFVRPVQARMVDCIWRIVRDAHETEDVVQESLVHIVARLDDVRRHPNPTALILRMCANKALDHVRSRTSRNNALDRLALVPEAVSSNPARDLAKAEDRRVILDFLRTIPEREAEAITLHALEELPYPDVAAAMGCAESTVRVLVGRARERFREAFRGNSNASTDQSVLNSNSIEP